MNNNTNTDSETLPFTAERVRGIIRSAIGFKDELVWDYGHAAVASVCADIETKVAAALALLERGQLEQATKFANEAEDIGNCAAFQRSQPRGLTFADVVSPENWASYGGGSL